MSECYIKSLLDNDLYKFSMGQAILHQFPTYMTGWTFKCRNTNVHFTKKMVQEIQTQVSLYCGLRFKEDELKFLAKLEWIKSDYIAYLRFWHPCQSDITITTDGPCGLTITTFGSWLNTSMYEVPILAIVSEVYYRFSGKYLEAYEEFIERTDEKYEALKSGKWYVGTFTNFGLRRRMSAEAEEYSVKKFMHLNDTVQCASTFLGVSNVYLGYKYGLKVFGTMAHEWIMCAGQGNPKHNPAYSNWYALNAWVREYGVLNGTALTDTITTKCFQRDFQKTFATLFSGVRHDSGDPFEWGESMIRHYESLGIDPMTKTLLFSDSLNFEKMDAIFRHFNGRARVSAGIGTYLTNNSSLTPLNIVMKVTECNGMPVAKLSDCEGKGMCKDIAYVMRLKSEIEWRYRMEGVA